MFLNEHEGKRLFNMLDILVPRGDIATTTDEAARVSRELGFPVTIKPLVLTGRRGVAGCVRQARQLSEAAHVADQLLGSELGDQTISALRVEECITFQGELYVSVTLDRARGQLVGLVGSSGGIEVEQICVGDIAMMRIPMLRPLRRYEARDAVQRVGLTGRALMSTAHVLYALAEGAKRHDLLLAEINPLFLLPSGKVVAGDAKVIVDDDAVVRQRGWLDSIIQDRGQVDADGGHSESELGLIGLGGNIGVVGGGAGICLATIDAIAKLGGRPANFLDVGGAVSWERVAAALGLVASLGVEGILVNMFGGLVDCTKIASGVVKAVQKVPILQPVVVRVQGRAEVEAWAALEAAGVDTVRQGTTNEAAERLLWLVAQKKGRPDSGNPAR